MSYMKPSILGIVLSSSITSSSTFSNVVANSMVEHLDNASLNTSSFNNCFILLLPNRSEGPILIVDTLYPLLLNKSIALFNLSNDPILLPALFTKHPLHLNSHPDSISQLNRTLISCPSPTPTSKSL